MNTILVKAVEMYERPNRKFLGFSLIIISLMLALSWIIVYFTGGTKYVYLHVSYLPIVFSAFLFRVKGGVIAALVAGILIGPLMPLDVENNLNQPILATAYRTCFFVLVGGAVGYMSEWLKSQLIVVQEKLDEVSILYANTLENCAKMISIRDEQTAFHCERVAYNAQILGQKAGLDEQENAVLYWAGLLHDVGKIGVKEEILLKPGKLTESEFTQMSKHTIIGHDLIMSLSKDLQLVADGVRSHHEKWDGSGYPDRLKETEIPLSGRILAVVDVFEALTSERPYKKAWDPQDAMDYLIENKGIHFDPMLVDHFKQLFEKGAIWISDQPIKLNKKLKPTKFNQELLNYSQ